ncbi:hypothetical protein PR002_g21783 [Phytophthora rubi]|uniref:Uncharacterized protein n=1 Tax=Phytophthora rubi TaxID=129364 RepID=A0A6A3J212_9STRA|nr:hypothetical protein PR002_g21783 [Phytophthora rubi]
MKQLVLDAFFTSGGTASDGGSAYRREQDVIKPERSVLQAFAEYEDVPQNVFVCRSRTRLTDEFPSCRCSPRAD